MILMLCGNCQMDMMVHDVQYVANSDGTGFKMLYHIGCENFHKAIIEGQLYIINPDSAESRVIQYLIEESSKRYGKTISN